MKDINCPVCNSRQTNRQIKWLGGYNVHKCNDCNLIFSNPLPKETDLVDFYQGFQYRIPDKNKTNKLIENKKKELSELLGKSNIKITNILDYGGGTGVTYQALKEMGYNVYFHDLDQTAVDFVKQEFSLEDSHTIHDVTTCAIKFDCILSDNVIEHVIDPKGFISDLHSALTPGGMLVLKTPNASNTEVYFFLKIAASYYSLTRQNNSFFLSIKALLVDRFWNCDPPRHIWSFSKKNYSLLAQNAGVSIPNIKIGYYSASVFEYSFLTNKYLLTPGTIKGVVLRVITFPIAILELLLKIIQYSLRNIGLISRQGITMYLYR